MKINIDGKNIEKYRASSTNGRSHLSCLAVLGISEGYENKKDFEPGSIICEIIEKAGEFACDSYILGVPGMGGSDGDTFECSLEERSENILRLLEQSQDGERAWLIGHSMGAAAIILAVSRLEDAGRSVAGISLIAPAAYPPGSEKMCFGPDFKAAIQDVGNTALFYADILITLPADTPTRLYLPEYDTRIPGFITDAFVSAMEARSDAIIRTIWGASHGLKGLDEQEGSMLADMIVADMYALSPTLAAA